MVQSQLNNVSFTGEEGLGDGVRREFFQGTVGIFLRFIVSEVVLTTTYDSF